MAKHMCFVQCVKKGETPVAGTCRKSQSFSEGGKHGNYLFKAFSESDVTFNPNDASQCYCSSLSPVCWSTAGLECSQNGLVRKIVHLRKKTGKSRDRFMAIFKTHLNKLLHTYSNDISKDMSTKISRHWSCPSFTNNDKFSLVKYSRDFTSSGYSTMSVADSAITTSQSQIMSKKETHKGYPDTSSFQQRESPIIKSKSNKSAMNKAVKPPGVKSSRKRQEQGFCMQTLQDYSEVSGSQVGSCNVTCTGPSPGASSLMEIIQMSEKHASACSSGQYWSRSESDYVVIMEGTKLMTITPPTDYCSLVSCDSEKQSSQIFKLLSSISPGISFSSTLFEPRKLFSDAREGVGPIPTIMITPPTPVNSLTDVAEKKSSDIKEFTWSRCPSAPLLGSACGTNMSSFERVNPCLSMPALVNIDQLSSECMQEPSEKHVRQKSNSLSTLHLTQHDEKMTEEDTMIEVLCLPERDLAQKASLPPSSEDDSSPEPSEAVEVATEAPTEAPTPDSCRDAPRSHVLSKHMIKCTSSVSCPALSDDTQETRLGERRKVRFASSLDLYPYESGPICNELLVQKIKLDALKLKLDEERKSPIVECAAHKQKFRCKGIWSRLRKMKNKVKKNITKALKTCCVCQHS